jgi:hypothetical protein
MTIAAAATTIPSATFAKSPRVGIGGELTLQEIEVIGDQREIGSRAINLFQRKRAIIWHVHVLTEAGCQIVSGMSSGTGRPPPKKGIALVTCGCMVVAWSFWYPFETRINPWFSLSPLCNRNGRLASGSGIVFN